MFSNELKKLIAGEIIDDLKGYEGSNVSELAYEMYNQDYYIIGTYDAKRFISKYIDDCFEALEQYNDNFGEQYADITNLEKLASLMALMAAEELFSEVVESEEWDEELTEEITDRMIDALRQY